MLVLQVRMSTLSGSVGVQDIAQLLQWMSDHEDACRAAHLPQLLFTDDNCIYFTA